MAVRMPRVTVKKTYRVFRHLTAFSICHRKSSGKILLRKFSLGKCRYCFPEMSGKQINFEKSITSPILLQKKKKKKFWNRKNEENTMAHSECLDYCRFF